MAISPPISSDDSLDFYPSGDGKPMAETPEHRDQIFYCVSALQERYRGRSDVWVSGNDFIYYEEGNNKARVSPDCYVVFGVERRQRDSYFVWREGGITPAIVFEITSRKTRREDTRVKRPLYESMLHVPEYVQFDPTGDYLKPRLQGWRLENGRYVALPLVDDRIYSEQLGLDLMIEGDHLRFYDPIQGVRLLSYKEQKQRTDEAEAEIARLRAELESLRRLQE